MKEIGRKITGVLIALAGFLDLIVGIIEGTFFKSTEKNIDRNLNNQYTESHKFNFNTQRIIYALASIALAYKSFVEIVIIQRAWIMIIIPLVFVFMTFLYIKNILNNSKTNSIEKKMNLLGKMDFLGFLFVILLFLQACGVNTF